MSEQFEFKTIEKKWQDKWEEAGAFEVDPDSDKDKYYVLEMFPYPSGTLHMGHVRNYSLGDVVARYKKMRGFNVIHPMGWDALGLPAEQAAIKHNTHPNEWTVQNIQKMRDQFRKMGCSFDWRRELATCDPDYYRHEQKFFIELFEKGLAYKKLSSVNWCPSCSTVLANEQVENGACWRCESEVTTKELSQWFLRTTDYAEELLNGLDSLDGWPSRVKAMQRNWIGKSIGASVNFEVSDKFKTESADKIEIFTTRPDTIFGVTYMCLAPEHPLTIEFAKKSGREKEVQAFADKVRKISKLERSAEGFKKEGVFTGATAINPVNGEEIPIWTANFVLMDYGTGAVMAVPGHDQRDFEFATEYSIPIKRVITGGPDEGSPDLSQAWTESGELVNSGEFNGLPNKEGALKIVEMLESKQAGKKSINYRLRDWGVSRQRFWGCPIPMIYCERCEVLPVPKDQLPVTLPMDVSLTGEGENPLAGNESWIKTTCPKCDGPARRETDTFDTFMESSWYYIRYCSLAGAEEPLNKKNLSYWLPIDQYIGGVEHATMHLIYFRFFHKVLRDLGYLDESDATSEPAKRLMTQGMVCKDGAKMSKSKGNVVDPDGLFEKYGVDTARMFSLFAAPPVKDLEYSEQGVEGAYRFLNRVWRMVGAHLDLISAVQEYASHEEIKEPETKKLRTKIHETIGKVTSDMEGDFQFNTAISAVMELVNAIYAYKANPADQISRKVMKEAIETTIRLLAPFAPHISEELWSNLGHGTFLVHESGWPEVDELALVKESITIVVQVNGKLRGKIDVDASLSEDAIKEMALSQENVLKHVEGKQVRKVIVVPGRLVNVVVS